jgi:hypothetical protein
MWCAEAEGEAMTDDTTQMAHRARALSYALSDKANAVVRDWPSPGTADYSDGSASDGDRTDWSTQR